MHITDYLKKTAEKFPDKAAFVDEKRTLSFSELIKEAQSFADSIQTKGMPVLVETDRAVGTPVKLFGVLLSGNYYVPIDGKMPEEKKEEIKKQLAEAKQTEGLAYILFTSGSTGKPKGVEIEEESVISFAKRFINTFNIDENCTFGNQAPFCFDASMEELYATAFTGSTTYIMPKKLFSFPKLFGEYINNNSINTLNLSGSAFGLIAGSGVLEAYPPKHLKLVMVGNETVFASHLNIWRKACPGVQFVNAYGPTEATVESSYYFADATLPDVGSVPIGKPCEDVQIFLVDENGEESSEGEIYIAGPGLARGYYRDPSKTSASFINYKGVRVYKTGDRAKLDPEGNLVFVGRMDNQIKHAGYRIELGEIEAVVAKQPGVLESVCIYSAKDDIIKCFYSGSVSENELAATLRTQLSSYMLPGAYEKLESLPHNSNDKIDRKALEKRIN